MCCCVRGAVCQLPGVVSMRSCVTGTGTGNSTGGRILANYDGVGSGIECRVWGDLDIRNGFNYPIGVAVSTGTGTASKVAVVAICHDGAIMCPMPAIPVREGCAARLAGAGKCRSITMARLAAYNRAKGRECGGPARMTTGTFGRVPVNRWIRPGIANSPMADGTGPNVETE